MAYCAKCGSRLESNATCQCETSTLHPDIPTPAQTLSGSEAAAPRKGGSLALKGICLGICSNVLIMLVLACIGYSGRVRWGVLGWTVGAVYVLAVLFKWKRTAGAITGQIIVWATITLMLLTSMINLFYVRSGDDGQKTNMASSTPLPPHVTSPKPRDPKALEGALKAVSVTKDPAAQLEFYEPKPRKNEFISSFLRPYVGKSTTDGSKYLRLQVKVICPEPFLANKLVFLIDGAHEALDVNPFKEATLKLFERGDGASMIDISIDPTLLRRVANGKEVYVTLQNETTDKRADFKITPTDRDVVAHLLSLYDLI